MPEGTSELEVVVAIYQDTLTAEAPFAAVEELGDGRLADAATVIHTWDGRLEMQDLGEFTASRGAFAGDW